MANENIEIWDAVKQTKYEKTFEQLHDILANAQKDVDAAITSTLDIVCNISHSEAGTFWYHDKPGDGFIKAKAVYGGADLSKIKLVPGQGVAGQVIQTAKPRIVSNVETDKTWSAETDKETKFQTKSMLCVPLTARDNTFGCIQLINKTDDSYFDNKDLELVVNLAREISNLCERYNILIEEKEYDAVAILSVGMKDFFQGADALSPIDTGRALKTFFSIVEKPIKDNGGIIDKMCFENILAYWEYKKPEINENDNNLDEEPVNEAIIRACKAAQDILDTRSLLQRDVANKFKVSFSFSVGIAYGPAYIGDVGTLTIANHSIVGRTANVARYLQEKAGPSEIYVDEELAYEAGRSIKVSKVKSDFLHKNKAYIDMYELESINK